MMIKYASADSWNWDLDRLDGRLSTLVKVSSRGLIGEDLRSLVKRAGDSLAEQIRRLDVYPGEELVHHIALGTTETVGCFFAGVPVQTDRGFKPIEQIQVGDAVLTHRNRFRRVTEVFTGAYSGTRTTIRVGCQPEPSVSTGDHPFWIVRRKNFGVSRRCDCFLKGRGMTKADAVEKAVKESAEFVRADEVSVGDYVIVPIRPKVEVEAFDDDLAYMYGLYLSEGCRFRRYDRRRADHRETAGVVFSLSKQNDTAVIDVVERTAAKWDRSVYAQDSKSSDKGVRLFLRKKDFSEKCSRLFGDGAHNKFIHPEVFAQSDGWKRRFLAAYFDGDGCVAKNRKQSRYDGGLRASTVSLNLALDLQRMLAGLGVPSSVTRCMNRQANGCFGSRDGVIYELSIGSAYSRELLEGCERLDHVEHAERQKQSHAQVGRDYMLLPIRSVVNERVTGEIKYNFEVEEDHTYCTLVLSHNCNRNGDGFKAAACRRYHDTFRKHGRLYYDHKHDDPEKSYGVIKLSYFNEPMGRIELIISPNTTKAAAARNRGLVDTRYLPAVDRNDGRTGGSMACSIDYDICSNCHNKAASRRFYCTEDTCSRGGCKHNLTKVSEDGHVLHVDNPHPKWFDFSHVDKPADRTAFAFGRVGHHKQASLAHADTLSWKQATSADDRVRIALTKLADLEYELADAPFGPVDVGALRAAEAVGCAVTVTAWARRQFGGDPRKTAALAAGMKTAFNRLLLDPERELHPDPVRYYGTRCPDDREVMKQAAVASFAIPSSSSPAFADAACDALAVAQLGWCLAGHSGDDIDRRVKIVVHANRGV